MACIDKAWSRPCAQEIVGLRAALAAETQARRAAEARSSKAAEEARRLEGDLAQLEVDQREEVLTLRQVGVRATTVAMVH